MIGGGSLGKQLKVLDLFAGAGGMSTGFHEADFMTAVAIDHDAFCVETLHGNFGHLGTQVLKKDLAEFRPSDLGTWLRKNSISETFDVICGGPPCQGWSSIGRGKIQSLARRSGKKLQGKDPRNEMFRFFIDYIRYFQPSVALMENVPGMLSHYGTNVAEIVADQISMAGYRVTWSMINAANYGVPQNRDRIFFIGVRRDLGMSFEFPEWRTKSGKRLYPQHTVADAIGDLPPISSGSQEWVRPYQHSWKQLSSYAKAMRKGADKSAIFDHVCRTHNEQDLEAFRLMKQGGWYRDLPERLQRYRTDIFEDKYKKLHWNRPSWCVTAHLSRDCYTHIHPRQTRTISVREAARLQSFPDRFYFGGGGMGPKFRLIGNAVPPMLIEILAKEIRTQIFDGKTRQKGAPLTRTKDAEVKRV